MSIDKDLTKFTPEIIFQGRTSAAGNVGGTTFVDTALAGHDIPVGTIVVIYTDDPTNDTFRGVLAFDGVSTVTLATAAAAQIPQGTAYALLASSSGVGGSILASGMVVASGLLTTSSTTVPADAARTEVNDYWDGLLFMPIEGADRGQVRRIETWTQAGGVFKLDPAKPLTTLPGLVHYVILASQVDYAAVTNSADNILARDVLGAKDDTALLTPANVRSLVCYIKGIVTYINGTNTDGISGALNLTGAGVAIPGLTITHLTNPTEINGVFVSMVNCTVGATINFKVYRAINGVEDKVDDFSLIAGTDPNIVPIVNAWVPLVITAAGVNSFRVVMSSSAAGDNAVTVPYSISTRTMQF